MPTLKIWNTEITDGKLPPVCLVCGKPASCRMYGKLAAPSWQAALLSPLISLLGGWVHIAWQSRATAADVHAGLPFCEKHAPYWARRSFIIVGGWLLAAALVLLCVAFSFLPAVGDVIMGVTALYVVLFLPTFILNPLDLDEAYVQRRRVGDHKRGVRCVRESR